ncbi:hybrid sensor histidine kinase/response regulator [Pararoseomonas indoligenes]|uniref:histidine kinase n=1 Tax=Roseomonas indoligenes TaxID=2820811 RepID=A0A940MSK3_9PROT|nr:PAS domain-containing sensor histidine kinase [Pararoseomonas indoligenes]MBP0492664.1 response regulator [Pararoseomonas indoligenes]
MPSSDGLAALVFMPHGRDASIAEELLRGAGAVSRICRDLAAFEAAIDEQAGFAVVTEEALVGADLRGILARIAAQPAWSDLPFIVLTRGGGAPEHNPNAARLAELLGNATFLERPFRPTTFVSVARSALKGRQRQFEARARIEELHETGERLSTALQAGRLGSWELEAETGLLTVSDTCKAVFGRSPAAPFTYEDLLASIHPDDRAAMQAAVRASIERGADHVIEYRTIWPDGSTHWAEVRARLVRDRDGSRPRLVGVYSDITVRRMAEEGLRRLNETLEERVAARTAELREAHDAMLAEAEQRRVAEELLQQSQKMEAVGQLTGGLAHDFNNLLTGIIGSLELIQRRVEQNRTADLGRYLGSAKVAAGRAAALTHRLLAFSRRQTLDPKPTALNQLVAGMEELVVRSIGPAIELHSLLSDDLWTTLVDPNQLENALLNLCINARDAMPDGGVLTIKTANLALDGPAARALELSPGPYVTLAVTDTGTGMSPEVIERAFDPFFTTKPLGQGTGLGLSMIYGFARQSHGQVRIHSELGRGTTVCLYLPRHAGAATVAGEMPALTDAGRTTAGETVLVVDDEPTVRMLAAEVLQDLGYAAVEAADGPEGLRILQSDRRIDLLVTDVGLPGGMNGRQLADAARVLRPGLRVLFITGYAETAVIGDGDLDVGMQVLTKPFAMETLASRIKALIQSG